MLVEDNPFNVKSLTEEQKRMRELMGFTYKDNSHDILSEQLFSKDRRRYRKNKRKSKKSKKNVTTISITQGNWNEKWSGSLLTNFMTQFPVAYNVGPNQLAIVAGSSDRLAVKQPKLDIPDPNIKISADTGFTVDDFEIGNSVEFYPDNIVTPNWDDEGVKEVFNDIVTQFVDYIDNGGLDKLTNITIQGQADKANPTWDIPSGYSKLDHKYGGIKKKKQSEYTDDELDEMNTFLAKERAFNFKMALINAVKEKTGEKIEIKELTPINHRGQEGKRGGKYRSMILKSNAPLHRVVTDDPIKLKKWQDYLKKKKHQEEELASGFYPADVAVNINGKFNYYPGVEINSTTQGEEKIVNFYVDKSPSVNGNYIESKVFVSIDVVEKLNFGKPNSGKILKNCTMTPTTLTVDGGRGDVKMYRSKFISDANNDAFNFLNSYDKMDPYIKLSSKMGETWIFDAPFNYVTNESKKINGKIYLRLRALWFVYSNQFGMDYKYLLKGEQIRFGSKTKLGAGSGEIQDDMFE